MDHDSNSSRTGRTAADPANAPAGAASPASSEGPPSHKSTDAPSIAIIGAGFSGICMGIQLLQNGYSNFTIYEAADAIGGTWRDNTYPGCACDIRAEQYHFSFEPALWDAPYVGQEKILQYLHHCVDKYQLKPHIQLNTRITAAVFQEDKAEWRLTTAEGQQSQAKILVLAQGGLAIPQIPNIPGLDKFPGTIFHSAQWNHTYDLTNKRVAVVGTGASAVQIIPCIQPLVKHLTVFQRTPCWVASRKDFIRRTNTGSACIAAAAIALAAAAAAAVIGSIWGWQAAAAAAVTVAAVLAAAAAVNWRLRLWWQRQVQFWVNEVLLGPAVTRNNQWLISLLTSMAMGNLNKSVPNRQLRAKLTPNYPIGCKRILASDTYYQALQANNATLVTSAVKEVTADGTIIADDGSTASDVDAIIFATGFDVGASLQFKNISMQGLAGKDLNKTLASDPYGTYLGLAVSGFPNMFIMMGPNTWLGHNSVIFMMECGVNLIMKLLNATRKLGVNFRCLEVRESSQRGFSHEAQNRLKGSVWLSGGCSSWYLPQNNNNSDNNLPLNGIEAAPILSNDDVAAAEVVDGSKVACVMWVGSCVEYWWRTLWPRKRDWAVTTS